MLRVLRRKQTKQVSNNSLSKELVESEDEVGLSLTTCGRATSKTGDGCPLTTSRLNSGRNDRRWSLTFRMYTQRPSFQGLSTERARIT